MLQKRQRNSTFRGIDIAPINAGEARFETIEGFGTISRVVYEISHALSPHQIRSSCRAWVVPGGLVCMVDSVEDIHPKSAYATLIVVALNQKQAV